MKKVLALIFALLATPAGAQTIPSGAWGSINYWGVGGLSQVLAPGLAGQCLTSQNVGSAPIWVNCQVSSLSLLPPISANSIMANNTLNFVAPQAIDVNRVLDMVGYDIIRPPVPESIIYKSNVGPNFNWQTLPPGTAGSLLTSGGPTNPIFWATSPAQGNLAAICATVGAVLYFDTPSLLWKCLNPGTSGQLLQTGGAAGNPSWLTVTLATLGGVPSTRNVNTSSPLGGGGALSADLTLTCPTCATTTNGGALSATTPETISAAGVIACPTCATTTNGGALSATTPVTLSAAGVIAMTNQGTTTTLLHGNAAGNPAFSAIVAADLPLGVSNNTRSAYTSVNSMATTDCGKTVALGGSAFYTFTVNAASTYNSACQVIIVNEDSNCPSGGAATCRGKTIAINGYSNFILWPGQTFALVNQNNVWQWENPGRWQPKTTMVWYVNHASGSASSDGLATGAGAFNTNQKCIDTMIAAIDFGGSLAPTCKAAAETFTENSISCILPLTGTIAVNLTGDTVTPANVVWQVSTGGGLQVRDGCGVVVSGFKMTGTAALGFCLLTVGQDGLLDFGVIEFGTNTGNNNICITSGGGLGYGGGQVTVSGNFNDFLYAIGEGHAILDGMALNISAVTFANMIESVTNSVISVTSWTVTGAGAGAGSTGTKYLVSRGSQLNQTSTTLPGATAGSVFEGGIVLPLLASKTNDNAVSGDIGEYMESVLVSGSAVALVTSTGKTITSITLTSGDWDVSAMALIAPAGTTNITRYAAGLSSVANTLDATVGKLTDTSVPAFVPGTVNLSQSIPPYRVSVASGATSQIFLIGFATFTVSTTGAFGIIRARRMR